MSTVRYCPECDEEYQPHITTCSDCGSALVDVDPEREETPVSPEVQADDGSEYVTVAQDLGSGHADLVGRKLTEAGIPFRIAVRGIRFSIGVRPQDTTAAGVVLRKTRAVRRTAEPEPPAVNEAGGPCPACGATVEPGAAECPECGLGLGAMPDPEE